MRILKRVIVIVPPFTRAFLKSPSSRGLSAIAELLVQFQFCYLPTHSSVIVQSCTVQSCNFSVTATSSNWKKSSVGQRGLCFATTSTLPLLLVSWSASNGHYILSTRRTNSRLTLFYKAVHDQAGICLRHLQKPLRNTRSADDTTFIALSARKNPYLFSFFLRLLLIGTNCHANSA